MFSNPFYFDEVEKKLMSRKKVNDLYYFPKTKNDREKNLKICLFPQSGEFVTNAFYFES